MRHLRLILAAAGMAALACSGDDSPSAPTGGGSSTVTVGTPSGGLTFSPTNVTVAPNGTVTWSWNSGGVVHDVTFPDSHSGAMSSGTFQKTFPTAGTFNYHCAIHGEAMSGTVTVSSSSGDNGGSNGGTGGSGGGGGGAYP